MSTGNTNSDFIACRNCGCLFKGSYCSDCGQPSDTRRIDFKFILEEIKKLLLKFDSGFFYTLKELTLAPGKTVKSYLEGKRIQHVRPLTFLILLAGIYSFLYHYFDINIFTASASDSPVSSQEMNSHYDRNYSLIQILMVPLYALASMMAFPKGIYNFYEYLILNAYLSGHRIFFNIVLFPFAYLVNETEYVMMFVNINLVIGLLYHLWAYSQIFDSLSKGSVFMRAVLVNLYMFLFMFILLAISIYLGFI
jgi:hypothetical protein